MDEDAEETEYVRSLPWSWPGFAYDVCALVGRTLEVANHFLNDVAQQFASMHNLRVDRFQAKVDGEKFAREVLSGLNDL